MSEKERKRQKIEAYLNGNVRPVFDRLITELLASLPEDIVEEEARHYYYYLRSPGQ